jgi:hypothetical protein
MLHIRGCGQDGVSCCPFLRVRGRPHTTRPWLCLPNDGCRSHTIDRPRADSTISGSGLRGKCVCLHFYMTRRRDYRSIVVHCIYRLFLCNTRSDAIHFFVNRWISSIVHDHIVQLDQAACATLAREEDWKYLLYIVHLQFWIHFVSVQTQCQGLYKPFQIPNAVWNAFIVSSSPSEAVATSL